MDAGLLQRVPYAEDREEYRLTEAGLELFPAIVILMKWEDRYVPDPDGPAILLEHSACGQVGDAYVACRCCGEEITAHNVNARS